MASSSLHPCTLFPSLSSLSPHPEPSAPSLPALSSQYRRRRTALAIVSSSITNAREGAKQRMLESYGLDSSEFISDYPQSSERGRRRRRKEEERTGEGKRMDRPPEEPRPPRATHKLLQVLGGKARRKKLLSPKGMDVRPMMEVVKGAAFGMLQAAGGCPASLRPGRWLDLYSGTGSVGIEAISRGCSEAHFVEMDPWVVSEVLRPNLEWTGFLDVSVIHTVRVDNFLEQVDKSQDKDNSFDYISVTPPYTAVDYSILMEQLGKSPLVKEDCFILVEYPLKTLMEETCGHLIKIADRRFGRTNLLIYGPVWAQKKRKSGRLLQME